MTTYTVQISDRRRNRTIDADDPESAVRSVIGSRCLNVRLDHRQMAQDNERVISRVYECMVRIGATRGGSTPFKNVRAYVSE